MCVCIVFKNTRRREVILKENNAKSMDMFFYFFLLARHIFAKDVKLCQTRPSSACMHRKSIEKYSAVECTNKFCVNGS